MLLCRSLRRVSLTHESETEPRAEKLIGRFAPFSYIWSPRGRQRGGTWFTISRRITRADLVSRSVRLRTTRVSLYLDTAKCVCARARAQKGDISTTKVSRTLTKRDFRISRFSSRELRSRVAEELESPSRANFQRECWRADRRCETAIRNDNGTVHREAPSRVAPARLFQAPSYDTSVDQARGAVYHAVSERARRVNARHFLAAGDSYLSTRARHF